jgi:hypothetical protein
VGDKNPAEKIGLPEIPDAFLQKSVYVALSGFVVGG